MIEKAEINALQTPAVLSKWQIQAIEVLYGGDINCRLNNYVINHITIERAPKSTKDVHAVNCCGLYMSKSVPAI